LDWPLPWNPAAPTISTQGVLEVLLNVPGVYYFTVEAKDVTGRTDTETVRFLAVAFNPPTEDTENAPPTEETEGTTGSEELEISNGDVYGYAREAFVGQVSVSGGTAPYSYGGSGAGLSVDAEGKIYGTFGPPGTYTLSLNASDTKGVSDSKTVSVIVTVRPDRDPTEEPTENPEGGGNWVRNEVEKVCPYDLGGGKKPIAKLSWEEFRVYRPAPNSDKYDITKFRGLIWVLRHKELPTRVIQGGSGSIWLGSHKITHDTRFYSGKPDFISEAYTRDGKWPWSGFGTPDFRYFAWKQDSLEGFIEGDSVGMNYGESVQKANGDWGWWKVEFTAPKSGPPPPKP
jgi:hypothetical protein